MRAAFLSFDQARRWIANAVATRCEWAAAIIQRHYRARLGRKSFLGTLRRQQNAMLLVIEERAALMVQQAWRLKIAWRNIVLQLKDEYRVYRDHATEAPFWMNLRTREIYWNKPVIMTHVHETTAMLLLLKLKWI